MIIIFFLNLFSSFSHFVDLLLVARLTARLLDLKREKSIPNSIKLIPTRIVLCGVFFANFCWKRDFFSSIRGELNFSVFFPCFFLRPQKVSSHCELRK